MRDGNYRGERPGVPLSYSRTNLHGFLVEIGAVTVVVLMYAMIALPMVSASVLYLGGDTTREAWRAGEFFRTGHFSHLYGAPYDSEYFALLLLPFVKIFGRTILCLQLATLSFGLATTIVFYSFLRTVFGVVPAVLLACELATSPLFLAHTAAGPLLNAPLQLSIFLLVVTLDRPWAAPAAAASAGLFASLNAYFLIPATAYFLSGLVLRSSGKGCIDWAKCRLAAVCFALGTSPIIWKFFAAGPEQGSASVWTAAFLRSNWQRWHSPAALLGNVWLQWASGLTRFVTYHPAQGPFGWSWIAVAWALTFLCSLLIWRESRRYSVLLLASGLLVALFQSTSGGLGMRHILVFLPFQWLFLAPILSRPQWQGSKTLVAMVLCSIIADQSYAACLMARRAAPVSADIIANTEYSARFIRQRADVRATVEAADENAFFSLLFLVPGGKIDLNPTLPSTERTGRIRCTSAAKQTSGTTPGQTMIVARHLLLSGRTSYDLEWERYSSLVALRHQTSTGRRH